MNKAVAFIGNPNTGKTTIFNSISDQYAYVGNWTGVTVEKKVGQLKNSKTQLVDLPGVYSLSPLTKDETVVTNYLLNEQPDLILNVVNANQLQRNLLLTIELIERGCPLIIDLNMIDDLHRSGYDINTKKMADLLGCRVVTTNARNHEGVKELRQEIINENDQQQLHQLHYPAKIEDAIHKVLEKLTEQNQLDKAFARWLVIEAFNQNSAVRKFAAEHYLDALTSMDVQADKEKFSEQIYETRLHFIQQLIKQCLVVNLSGKRPSLTAKIDRIATHPILGVVVFVGIFWLIFKISFDWVGTPLSDILDRWISGPVSTVINHWLASVGAMPVLRSLIVNGIITGVGGVLVFIPQIFVLFACITILEDSGYMARAALVTDRLMQTIGLSGQSFIPLIIGFGCNVTGIMAARTIQQPKERLVTTLIEPFMSCSARLPIYSLFVAAFFPKHQAVIVLSLYFLGIAVALLVAKVYQIIFHLRHESLFAIELPEYHLPRLEIVLHGTWDKGKGFVHKAGTVIFAGTVLIWFLTDFSMHGFTTHADASFAAGIGHALLPLFHPLGVTTWQPISALITGILAKEVITSSMMVMFHTSSQATLIASIGHFFNPVAAYALLVFILLYTPCFATIGTIKAETGSYKWPAYSVVSSLIIAYLVATLIFQVGSLIFWGEKMKLLINLIIVVLIVALAVWQLFKTLKRAKKGKCAACDYKCPIKQKMDPMKMHSLKQ